MILEVIHLSSAPEIFASDRVIEEIVRHKPYCDWLIWYSCLTRSIVPIRHAKLIIQLNIDRAKPAATIYRIAIYGCRTSQVWATPGQAPYSMAAI